MPQHNAEILWTFQNHFCLLKKRNLFFFGITTANLKSYRNSASCTQFELSNYMCRTFRLKLLQFRVCSFFIHSQFDDSMYNIIDLFVILVLLSGYNVEGQQEGVSLQLSRWAFWQGSWVFQVKKFLHKYFLFTFYPCSFFVYFKTYLRLMLLGFRNNPQVGMRNYILLPILPPNPIKIIVLEIIT